MILRHIDIENHVKLPSGYVFPVRLGVPPDYDPHLSVDLRTFVVSRRVLEITIRWQNESRDTWQYIALVVNAAMDMFDPSETLPLPGGLMRRAAEEHAKMVVMAGIISPSIHHRTEGALLNQLDEHIHEWLQQPPPLPPTSGSPSPPPREYPPDTGNPYQSPAP